MNSNPVARARACIFLLLCVSVLVTGNAFAGFQPPITLTGAIQTVTGNFITAVNQGGQSGGGDLNPLSAADSVSNILFETPLRIVWVNRQQCKFALQIPGSGHFITANHGGGLGKGQNDPTLHSPLHTDAMTAGGWENGFSLQIQPDGASVFIVTPDGQHLVTVASDNIGTVTDSAPFHTNATNIGAWETFNLSPLSSCFVTEAVGNSPSNPVYVNLYWDTTWDVDNPSLPKASLDSFTAAVVNSAYFGQLSEYGVRSASFGGGFVPAAACTQQSPASPGFYDPFNASIIGFLNCEIQHGGVPTGGNVIYNIILPSYATESDAFGNATQCNGNPGGWHFHGTPYDPAVTAAIAASLLTGTPPLETIVGLMGSALSNSGPIWTITSTNPTCGPFTNTLVHEMVEAASDPFPPVSVVLSGSGEIADECVGMQDTSPFVPPPNIGQVLAGGVQGGPFTTRSVISIPGYWSNANQVCSTGFTNLTAPGGANPSASINSGQGPTLSMTITGAGFGSMPAQSNAVLPYIGLQDTSQGWQAGNSLNEDLFGINIKSWTDASITINGIGHVGNDFTMKSADTLSVWVCNPASGNCVSIPNANISKYATSFSPSLAIVLSVPQPAKYIPTVSASVDGKVVGGLTGDGSTTGWRSQTIGSHTVSAVLAPSQSGTYTISYIAGCDAKGNFTLGDGQNLTCIVAATANEIVNTSGCGEGERCCEEGKGKCKMCRPAGPRNSCP